MQYPWNELIILFSGALESVMRKIGAEEKYSAMFLIIKKIKTKEFHPRLVLEGTSWYENGMHEAPRALIVFMGETQRKISMKSYACSYLFCIKNDKDRTASFRLHASQTLMGRNASGASPFMKQYGKWLVITYCLLCIVTKIILFLVLPCKSASP